MASDFPSAPDAVDQPLGLCDLDCTRAIFFEPAAPAALPSKISANLLTTSSRALRPRLPSKSPGKPSPHHLTPSPQAPSASRPQTRPLPSGRSVRAFSAGRASRAAFRVPTRARCAARARRARPSSSRTRRRARCPSRPTSRRRSRRGRPRRRRRTRAAPRRRRRSARTVPLMLYRPSDVTLKRMGVAAGGAEANGGDRAAPPVDARARARRPAAQGRRAPERGGGAARRAASRRSR